MFFGFLGFGVFMKVQTTPQRYTYDTFNTFNTFIIINTIRNKRAREGIKYFIQFRERILDKKLCHRLTNLKKETQ